MHAAARVGDAVIEMGEPHDGTFLPTALPRRYGDFYRLGRQECMSLLVAKFQSDISPSRLVV